MGLFSQLLSNIANKSKHSWFWNYENCSACILVAHVLVTRWLRMRTRILAQAHGKGGDSDRGVKSEVTIMKVASRSVLLSAASS